jgi:hypothetical protein
MTWLQRNNPATQFKDAIANSNFMKDGLLGDVMGGINQMVASVPENPMSALFQKLFGEEEPAGGAPPAAPVFQEIPQQGEVPVSSQPPLSALEQQIQFLMETKGMNREQAMRNQNNALELGTDYNNDGAVTGDEWKRFGQTPTGAQYRAKHEPNWRPRGGQQMGGQQMGGQPMPPGNIQLPGGGQYGLDANRLSPDQRQALFNFDRYRGGNGGQ